MKHCLTVKALGGAILFLFLALNPLLAQKRIMPLGDSITEGVLSGSPIGGYRDDLDALLNNAGVGFAFVGTLSDGSGFDTDHEGHNGMRADEIADGLNGWINQLGSSSPRWVLVHAGTNDITQNRNNQDIIGDIERIVDIIYNDESFNNMLLCSLIPRKDGKDGATTALNELIKELYYTKRNQGYDIYYVGQNEVFKANSNWATDYFEDDVHPSNAGFSVMAEVYFNALMNSFYTFSQGHAEPEITDNFQRSQPGITWADDSKYGIETNELANTSGVSNWELATYIAQTNPTRVAIKWSDTADAAGIGEGGLALKLDSPSATANGYLCWYSAAGIRLWTLSNGATEDQISIVQSNFPFPSGGDIVEVEMTSDGNGQHFKCFLNGQEDVTLTDPELQGSNSTLYAGVMLKGNLNNNISYFDLRGIQQAPDDETPPDAVSDLAAGSPTGNSITLTWSAVGDDGMNGTASSYDVRYSTNQINNDSDFNQATEASGEQTPSASGTPETFVVTSLQSNTTYYFAINKSDGVSNI